MESLVSVSGQYEIILTTEFDFMIDRLRGVQEVANFATFAVQLYASWIVYNSLWAEAAKAFWVDMETGEAYDDSLHAKKEVRHRLRFRRERLFPDQISFFNYLEETIPNFKVSTFWSRHRTIVNRVELWRRANGNSIDMPEDVFINIVRDVVLYGKRIDDVVIHGAFDVTPGKRGTASEIVKVSDTLNAEKIGADSSEISNLDSEESIKRVAIAAIEKIEEAHAQVRSGATVTSVVRDIKDEVFEQPTLFFGTKGSGIYLSYTPSNGGDIIPTTSYDIVFYESGKKVDVLDMPNDVLDYIERKLNVTIHD